MNFQFFELQVSVSVQTCQNVKDEIEEMIRDADANTELKIDYVRFVTMMMET